MNKRLLQRIVLAAAVLTIGAAGAFANVAPDPKQDREQVRSQLASYFRDIGKNSPTVLGGLAKSPDAMEAIQKRITSMSDEELANFQKLIAQSPDWKLAPEAFAAAFPPDMLQQIRRVGNDYVQQLPAAGKMRDDVLSLVSILKLLPDAKLKEIGIDRKMVDTLASTFQAMSPLQTAMLQRQAGPGNAWREQSAIAFQTLPPALQRGAAALAQHGPLTEKDIFELNQFRSELIGLMERIARLPSETRASLQIQGLVENVKQLREASPDIVFMIRHSLPAEMMKSLRSNVAFLERVSNFTEAEKKKLEAFRTDFGSTLEQVKMTGSGNWEQLDAMVASLTPAQLFLLQQGMESYGRWQEAMPALYQTLASPETAGRLRAVAGPNADPVALQNLETFRRDALTYIDATGPSSGLDPSLVARARGTMESASPARLELIRASAERMPSTASAAGRLSIALMGRLNLNCSLSMTAVPEVCVPEIGICPVCTPAFCTPAVTVTANFDSICNPIEDALAAVETSITSTANDAVATLRSGIETAINGVSATINASINAVTNVVNTAVSAIVTTVNQVSSFVQTIPNLVVNAVKAAFSALLSIQIKNGVTLGDLVASGAEHAMTSMTRLLGLADGWWQAVEKFTLPAIPCPPSGFHTPFGDVGDGAATDNYARYRLVIDGIVNMIPDTETSLEIKIPAKLLYMSFDFLGLCLQQASANADAAQLTTRHSLVLTNFAGLQTYIGAQVSGLAAASGAQTTTLVTLINNQSNNVQASILGNSAAIQSLLNLRSQQITDSIGSETTKIQTLFQKESDQTGADVAAFRKLSVRIAIERALQDQGNDGNLASIELRAPYGNLKLVSEIVKQTMDAMVQSSEGMGQAQKFYDKGVELMNAGKDKDAFAQFSQAYQQSTK